MDRKGYCTRLCEYLCLIQILTLIIHMICRFSIFDTVKFSYREESSTNIPRKILSAQQTPTIIAALGHYIPSVTAINRFASIWGRVPTMFMHPHWCHLEHGLRAMAGHFRELHPRAMCLIRASSSHHLHTCTRPPFLLAHCSGPEYAIGTSG